MNLERRRASIQRLFVTRLARDEVIFALMAIAVAVVAGVTALSPSVQIFLLSVAWSGLVGLMVPQLLEARRDAAALAAARHREARQRVLNHDMASALLTIEGGIQSLLYSYEDEDDAGASKSKAIVHAIEVEVRRMRRIAVSAPTRATKCWVADTLDPLLALHRASGVVVNVLLACEAQVAMSPDDLVRVMSNVLDNCSKYAPKAPITVSGFLEGNRYHLSIRDEGPGMPTDLCEHACERGVSTRDGGGLGLFSVRAIVDAAGGSVTVTSSRKGTEVNIELEAVAVSLRGAGSVESIWGRRGEAVA